MELKADAAQKKTIIISVTPYGGGKPVLYRVGYFEGDMCYGYKQTEFKKKGEINFSHQAYPVPEVTAFNIAVGRVQRLINKEE